MIPLSEDVNMKFNKTPIELKVRNEAGGIAFKTDQKTELFLRVASCLVGEDKFYTPGNRADGELIDLIHKVAETDPEYILKLAYFTRTHLYLRSVPMLLLAEFANSKAVGIPDSRKWVTSTIQRVDEMTELLAYQFGRNKQTGRKKSKVPMLLKEGIRKAFDKFDEYQLSKYLALDKSVKLRDAIFLTHPKPTEGYRQGIYDQIVNNKLTPPDDKKTISNKGATTKKQWEEILPTMGYMALLRNLSYMVTSGVNADLIVARLTNPESVRRSKQFPFRFWTASREVLNYPSNDIFARQKIGKALLKAMEISISNLPRLKGNTVIIADVSGSMTMKNLSKHSSVNLKDVATLFASLTSRMCDNAAVILFADQAKVYLPSNDILEFKAKLDIQHLGGSTEGWKAFKLLNDNKIAVDRIILFSDEQLYDSRHTVSGMFGNHREHSVAGEFQKYQRDVNPNVKMYSVDLAGYGTVQFPRGAKNVVTLAGWSDKILQFIPLYEEDGTTMVNTILNQKL